MIQPKTSFRNIAILLSLVYSICISCKKDTGIEKVDFDKIQSDFITPSKDNTLWCYWYWIGDDISKDGITKDLEAMKAAGIGGALIGNINPEEKDGKVPILSEEWWSHMVHAVNEGKRIGVDIGAFNCPGWSQSGGPWVKPEMAMRHMTYSEINIEGGKKINLQLTKPYEEFQDVYILAFPSLPSEKRSLSTKNSKINIIPSIKNTNYLFDKNTATVGNFSKKIEKHQINFNSNQSITARSLKILPGKTTIELECTVMAKVDGAFKNLKTFKINRSNLKPNVGANMYAPILESLPETKAKEFRLEFNVTPRIVKAMKAPNAKVQTFGISEIVISEAVGLQEFAEKNLGKMHPTPFPAWDSYLWQSQPKVNDASLKITPSNVMDISEKMDASGKLIWEAPVGNWTIQRFGMTPTGTKNSPAAPQGKGYEIDKANKELVQYHYEQYIGEFLKRIPEESKSAFKYVIADSYEMGSQNWTDGYEEKFEKQFGYNPKKYLPVFSGRIVGSVEESNRFLWDLRRSVADAVAYEYVGGLREASNEDNLQLWLENYGHWGFPSEFLMYGGQSDLVSGEFWNEGTLGNIECKSASSAAHIYGKSRISAEAFTAANRSYVRHPAMLKKRGDWAFTEGINHFVLHLYIHQPDDNRVPGVNAWFSTEFNRHNTWFKKSKTYFDYLRRSQHLLQQGTYTADVCYFIGENTPIMTGVRNPELPKGYSYDYINAEVILDRLSVSDGKFVLPDGMSYSLMVLPPFETMRPELLEKIESLVKQGGKIYGQAPVKSPSLQNYPESDEKVKQLATKMWGNSNEKLKQYGEGFIVNGLELQEAMKQLGIKKDIDLNSEVPVLWTHRKLNDMDIYFLTNQSDDSISFSPSFRVNGIKPQLWDAVTGEIRALPEFTEKDGRITVPIKMEGLQSWFIVFSNSDASTIDRKYLVNFPESKVVKTLENLWTVDFQNKNIGPKEPVEFSKLTDWATNENDKIKYYSGTAVYKSTFNYRKEDDNKSLLIDLGNLGVMASVKINGIDIGTTWIAPFQLKANDAIKDGENTIEVEVVNVWRNRLTGDKTLPKDQRTTWVNVDAVKPQEELISSGLLGPVTIQIIDGN
ncbi:glycosyl hydrolase [uncultured Polaribacter sp.]|uniref:glycosyl hydrolase n=1 Tax=uncultured Polaribacter sp. TaxID=174711 RepID=UPI00262FA2C4|nr:glycosyl hydrolase [uncultured Polaribacter sp.]